MCHPGCHTTSLSRHNEGRRHEQAGRTPDGGRIGDAQREQTTATLRAAATDGLLEVSELEERLERTWTARTYADLDPITADLALWAEERRTAERRVRRARASRTAVRYSTAIYLAAMAIMVAIWLITR